jgi:demethylmenaquinone methyltransferase/2-methoxy-6-polyprenyl-1,4-benzoquinol methylase
VRTPTDTKLPVGDEKARTVREMFDSVARRYDLVNRIMTFGMDVGWRRRAVRELRLPGGAVVADLGCGTGDLCTELERNGYRAAGFDFSRGMLEHATTSAPLVQADVLRLPLADGGIDGVTCGFALRNVTEVGALFAEVARALRVGGRAAFLETSEPAGRLLRAGHRVYFGRVVPLIGGALSDREAYRYLPRSMAYLPAPDELVEMMHSVGFGDATRLPLAGGVAQILSGTRT